MILYMYVYTMIYTLNISIYMILYVNFKGIEIELGGRDFVPKYGVVSIYVYKGHQADNAILTRFYLYLSWSMLKIWNRCIYLLLDSF